MGAACDGWFGCGEFGCGEFGSGEFGCGEFGSGTACDGDFGWMPWPSLRCHPCPRTPRPSQTPRSQNPHCPRTPRRRHHTHQSQSSMRAPRSRPVSSRRRLQRHRGLAVGSESVVVSTCMPRGLLGLAASRAPGRGRRPRRGGRRSRELAMAAARDRERRDEHMHASARDRERRDEHMHASARDREPVQPQPLLIARRCARRRHGWSCFASRRRVGHGWSWCAAARPPRRRLRRRPPRRRLRRRWTGRRRPRALGLSPGSLAGWQRRPP